MVLGSRADPPAAGAEPCEITAGGAQTGQLNIALRAIDEVDATLFVVDAVARADGREADAEKIALQRLKASGRPSILALNKIDALDKPRLLPLIQSYQERHSFTEIFPVSALTTTEFLPLPLSVMVTNDKPRAFAVTVTGELVGPALLRLM